MSERRLSVEGLAWLLILLLAAWSRLAALGRVPLDDAEAAEALAAAASSGTPSAFWPENAPTESPSYHALTGLLFAPLGPADVLARLAPALAGVALVMSPLLARGALGRGPALATALILLLSPTALATARTASGASLSALGWTIAVAALAYNNAPAERRALWAAVGAGLAVASGPHALMGLITLAIGWLLLSIWERRRAEGTLRPQAMRRRRAEPEAASLESLPPQALRRSALLGGIVALCLASGLGLFPAGLAGVFEGAGAWVDGWTQSSGYRLLPYLGMLPIYEPLALAFGLAGAWLTARGSDRRPRGELAWALASILVAIAYIGRTPSDLIWAVLPLAVLSGRALVALLGSLAQVVSWPAVGGFGAAAALLVCYAFLQLAGYASGLGGLDVALDFALQLGLAALGVVLAVLALLFLGWGWSWKSAAQAGGLAGFVLAAGLTLSAGWRLNYSPMAASAGELWRNQANTTGLRLLGHSLRMVSQAQTGRAEALPLRLAASAPAGLAWELRDFAPAGDDSQGGAPQLVLTPEEPQPPALQDDYLGQSFTISETWNWDTLLPPNFIRWLVVRKAPTEPVRWLMLVRSDLAGAGELSSQGSAP